MSQKHFVGDIKLAVVPDLSIFDQNKWTPILIN